MPVHPFPNDFVWGAATSSYQIEGGAHEGGRGPSIWDRFSHAPGNVFNGDTGDIADDHYHLWAEDIALMQSIGLQAYRFSIAWPRILPAGTGWVNREGLDFYDRLVDGLLAAGIKPYVTLFHWDLPLALEERGGWPNRDSIEWFAEYVDVVSRRLGDRVHHWITHNEPWVIAFAGYFSPKSWSGINDLSVALRAHHHLLASHGRAVSILRRNCPDSQVGVTMHQHWVEPASDSPEDVAAARRFDCYDNRLFLDPILKGRYPDLAGECFGPAMPEPAPGDMEAIAAPLDFIGLNYYTRLVIAAEPEAWLGCRQVAVPDVEHNDMGWENYPEGIFRVLRNLHEEYAPQAIYITENGTAVPDLPVDGHVHDVRRIAYLRQHLAQVHRAIQSGVPLRGYFVWSLLDNFEWSDGYSKRFGIVYVDYATRKRILKDSALFYRDVIAAGGLPV